MNKKTLLSKELMSELDKCTTTEALFGKGGLAKELIGNMVTYIMEKELEAKLGYTKHSHAGDKTTNRRNGYNEKTVCSSSGEILLKTPRDRDGEFESHTI